jgi:two-component system cell cycle sensor histidine kinase/response regulator CckA
VELGRHITILVVDDEPAVLALVRRCLDDQRVTLIEASIGKDALELTMVGQDLDLVITDLRMPEMEGDELARQVRAVAPDVKVLYMMSHADLLLEAKSQLWADEAYLDKPFTREGFEKLLRYCSSAARRSERAGDD